MEYTIINQINSENRKKRLNKDLELYKEYLATVSARAIQLVTNLKERSRLQKSRFDTRAHKQTQGLQNNQN